ncbi:MAG: hypothetical protein IID42_03565, partial [Planctomycetes bacterium]|nr:hypothetical protein [Planctomycetota bacterium]
MLRTVRLAVLAPDDGRADVPFGEAIVEGHLGLVQEGEEVIPVFGQLLGQPQGVGGAVDRLAVGALPLGQGGQPPVDQANAAFVALWPQKATPPGNLQVRRELLQFGRQDGLNVH